MEGYYILFIVLFLCYIVGYGVFGFKPNSTKSTIFLGIFFVFLYLFSALRSFSVGRDIPGYISVYEATKYVDWNNWTYVYMENGYKFLMKVCNIINLSAREYFALIYLIILFPIAYYIRRLSVLPFVSIIFFICFEFFTFDLTGLRQGIAMSLCLLAFTLATKPGKKYFIEYIVLCAIAYSIHSSSIVFFPAYFIMRLPITKKTILGYCGVAVFFEAINVAGVVGILDYFGRKRYSYSEDYTLGLSLVMIVLIAVLSLYTFYYYQKSDRTLNFRRFTIKYSTLSLFCANMLCTGVCTLLLFNGSILLRASMFYYASAIISLPLFFKTLGFITRIFAIFIFTAFFIWWFLNNELLPFDLVPYALGADI